MRFLEVIGKYTETAWVLTVWMLALAVLKALGFR